MGETCMYKHVRVISILLTSAQRKLMEKVPEAATVNSNVKVVTQHKSKRKSSVCGAFLGNYKYSIKYELLNMFKLNSNYSNLTL